MSVTFLNRSDILITSMPKVVYIGVMLFIVLFVAVASSASSMGAQEQIISGEAFVPSTVSPVLLSYSNIPNAIYNPYPEILVGSGNNLTSQGKDYTFYPNNGTILSVSGGALDGVANAEATYRYSQQNQWSGAMTDILGGLSNSLIPGMLFMVVISLLFVSFKNLTS